MVNPTFLPPSDDPPSAEDEFAALEADEPGDEIIIGVDEPPPPGRSWAYQWTGEERGFLRSIHNGRPLETRGDSTLVYWIDKTLRTAKGAHSIYSTDYGMNDPFRLIGITPTGHEVAEYQSDVHEALTLHPRIEDVIDFDVQQDPDSEVLEISFVVVKDDGSYITVSSLRLGTNV